MPAITVGQLAVDLEARSAEFRTALSNAEGRLDRFERRAGQATTQAGLSFRNLAGPILAVGTALAAIGATRGLVNIAEGAVQSASAFEGFEVRLRTLLNSQEAANKALETFVTLSSRTPFAVSQIVAGATTLSSVANQDRAQLEELTVVAGNLAAVTGLSFQEAAGNLQRSLAAGIASADLFRERGVRRLIEDVNGIPDLTKVSLEEQRRLFIATFGSAATAPFGRAAEDLSKTVSGALSNIGDASDNASRALGAALGPTVFATAQGVAIPFFNLLRSVIEDNADAITAFTTRGIAGLLDGLASTLDAGADVLEFFDQFGLQLGDLPEILGVVGQAFGIFFDAVKLGARTITTAIVVLGEAFARVGNLVGIVSDEDVALLASARQEAIGSLIDSSNEFGEQLAMRFDEIGKELEAVTTSGRAFTGELRSGADAIRRQSDEVENLSLKFQQARAAAAGASDEAAARAKRTAQDLQDLLGGFEDDPEFEQRRLEALIERNMELAREQAKAGRSAFEAELSGGLEDVLRGKGVNFAKTLGDLSGRAIDDSVGRVLDQLSRQFGDTLAGILQDVGSQVGGLFGEGGPAPGFGAAAVGALGIVGSLVASQISGTTSRARGGIAQSAVTSAQEVRGIVAGPSSIPIAEVGNAIRDANVESLREQRRGNSLLESILTAIRGLEPAQFESGNALADAIAREFTGSPALG